MGKIATRAKVEKTRNNGKTGKTTGSDLTLAKSWEEYQRVKGLRDSYEKLLESIKPGIVSDLRARGGRWSNGAGTLVYLSTVTRRTTNTDKLSGAMIAHGISETIRESIEKAAVKVTVSERLLTKVIK